MRIVTLGLIGAALLLAQDKTQDQTRGKPEKKTETRPPAPPAAAALPTVPQGAKEIEPNLYRYTDAEGKTWMYRKTPFGISKWEDKPVPPKPDTGAAPPVAITDLGDSVQFDRPTPFGNSRTIRKKAELTDDEKALIQREEARRAAKAQAPDKTPGKTTEKQ
jgi:hypothetical protein